MKSKFDELQDKISHTEKTELTEVTKDIQQAFEEGNLSKDERDKLVDQAKKTLGGTDVGPGAEI